MKIMDGSVMSEPPPAITLRIPETKPSSASNEISQGSNVMTVAITSFRGPFQSECPEAEEEANPIPEGRDSFEHLQCQTYSPPLSNDAA